MAKHHYPLTNTVWALCERPQLFVPEGTVGEVVAYLAGLCAGDGPTTIRSVGRFEDFVQWSGAEGGVAVEPPVADQQGSAQQLVRLLEAGDCDRPVARLWSLFEGYAAARLGVPLGTNPPARRPMHRGDDVVGDGPVGPRLVALERTDARGAAPSGGSTDRVTADASAPDSVERDAPLGLSERRRRELAIVPEPDA